MGSIATKQAALSLRRIACAVILGACLGTVSYQGAGFYSAEPSFGLSATALNAVKIALMFVPLFLAPFISVLIEFSTTHQVEVWEALRKLFLRIGIVYCILLVWLIWLVLDVKFAQDFNYVFLTLASPCILLLIICACLPATVAFTLTKTSRDEENHGGRLGICSLLGCILITVIFYTIQTQYTYNVADTNDYITRSIIFFGSVTILGLPFALIGGGWGADVRQNPS